MTTSPWKKIRDDENHIRWILKSDPQVVITAERTNPAPRRRFQGWNVTGFDRRGTFFRLEGADFKWQAKVRIEIAKNEYMQAHAEIF